MTDKIDKEVDGVFIDEYKAGRVNGLSITDAIHSAEGSARSRLKTIGENNGQTDSKTCPECGGYFRAMHYQPLIRQCDDCGHEVVFKR